MATADRSYRRYRVNNDFEDSGSDALLDTTTETDSKKPRCASLWTCVLVIVAVLVLFLLGFCLGYYVRESFNSLAIETFDCAANRKDNFNDSKLEDVHEKIMYYLSRDTKRIVDFVSDFGSEDPICHSREESRLEKTVEQEFEDYNFDSVSVEEYNTVTTHPDENKPNQIVVSDSSGKILSNISLVNSPSTEDKKSNSTTENPYRKFPFVAYTLGGSAKGELLYAHYGRESDLLALKSKNLPTNGSVLLIRLGKISVAEKLQYAQSAQAGAVLLYWDPQDSGADMPSNMSFIPYASAGSDVQKLFTIPTQTISANMAALLLGELKGEVVPKDWTGGFNISYKFGSVKEETVTVEVTTFNKKHQVYVRNVIGSLHGYSDPGSYVIMGAPRSSFPGSSSDALSSTAMMLQIARVLVMVQTSDQWKPRRGIKLISWGGAEFSNVGMREYIKANSNLLGTRAVAYIDLTELASGNKTIMATVTPAFSQLLLMSAKTVPNPLNTELMVIHDWDSKMAATTSHWSPFRPYTQDISRHPFLHIVGVPEIHLQFEGRSQDEDNVEAMKTLDKQHHFKFHIAVSRIATLAMLRLVDDYILPYSIKDYAESLHIRIWQTSESLRECTDGYRDLGPEWSLTEHLVQTSAAFNDFIKIYRQKHDILGVEYVNHVRMLFERIFVKRHFGERFASQHMLYPALNDDSSIEAIQELCRVADQSKHWDHVDLFQERLYAVLHEALKSLKN